MSETSIEVLGVFKPLIPPETYAEQLLEYGTVEETDAYFEQLVLIEALAHNVSGTVDMAIGQQPPWSADPNSMLVAYDEGLLSAEGDVLIERDMGCVNGTGTLRFAFYLQFYNPERPLETLYGPVKCPSKLQAPERLMTLMPYTVQT